MIRLLLKATGKGPLASEGDGATPSAAAQFGAAPSAHNQRRFKTAAPRSV